MARIPIYQQRTQAPSGQVASGVRMPVQGPDLGRAISGLGQQIEGEAAEWQHRMNQAAVKKIDADYTREVNDLLYGEDGFFLKQGEDAMNASAQVQERLREIRQRYTGVLGNDVQRQLFDGVATQREETVYRQTLEHTARETRAFEVNVSEARQNAARADAINAALFGDQAQFDTALGTVTAEVAGIGDKLGHSPEIIAQNVRTARSAAVAAAIVAVAGRDPVRAHEMMQARRGELDPATAAELEPKLLDARTEIEARRWAESGAGAVPAGFQGALAMVLEHEGGMTLVPDDNGAPSYAGIRATEPGGRRNGKRVQDLTPDEIARIYKTEYWDAIGADNLPPALAAVAFDAAVNHGPGKAREFLQQSGGDVETFLRLREGHYRALAASSPRYADDLNGWMNRLGSLRAMVAGGVPPSVTDPRQREIWTGTVNRVYAEQRAAENRRREELGNQAAEYLAAGQPVPQSLLLQMDGQDRLRFSTMQPDRPTNNETYAEISGLIANDPQAFLRANLLDYADRLSNADFRNFTDVQRNMRMGGDRGRQVQISWEAVGRVANGSAPQGWNKQRTDEFKATIYRLAMDMGVTDERQLMGLADRLLIETVRMRPADGIMGIGAGSKDIPLAEIGIRNVPQGAKNDITEAYRIRFGREPTDEEILREYQIARLRTPEADR